MSELMDRAVIGMPYEMAMGDELSRRQFYARAQALLAERNRLAAENERLARDAKNDSIAYRAVIERQEELRAEVEALKKDAERLDRLDIECEAYGCEGIHEGNRWMIDGPFRTVRDAIDAALQGAQP